MTMSANNNNNNNNNKSFQCDLCDAGYVGYTRTHLRVKGRKQQSFRHCQTLQECARDDASGPAKAFRSA